MRNRYYRRKFLTAVQGEVHALSLDEAVRRLDEAEANLRSRSSTHRWQQASSGHYRGLWNWIADRISMMSDEQQKHFNLTLTKPDDLDKWLSLEIQDPVQRESVGKQWYESRDFWRRHLLAMFPEPVYLDPTEKDPVI